MKKIFLLILLIASFAAKSQTLSGYRSDRSYEFRGISTTLPLYSSRDTYTEYTYPFHNLPGPARAFFKIWCQDVIFYRLGTDSSNINGDNMIKHPRMVVVGDTGILGSVHKDSIRWNVFNVHNLQNSLDSNVKFIDFNTLFNNRFATKTTNDLSEGNLNRYFTDARSRKAINLTTTGFGAATYDTSTGTLNIPTPPSAPVSGVFGRTGAVTAQSNDYTFAQIGSKPTTLSGYGITDATSNARSAISLTTTGTGAATYNSSTGALNIPTPTTSTPTFNNNVSRTIGAANTYTISTTLNARVYYTLTLSCATPLLAGSASASAFLEYSTNGGSSWITVSEVNNAQSVTLTVSVAITMPSNLVLAGEIPANALVRVRTSTSGTASITYVRGQEITY